MEIATVLPKELRLGVPPKMPQARSYLFRQQSTLSSYTSGKTIQINIPRLQRSYLRKDSYLRFRLNGSFKPINTCDSLVLDTSGAFGFFEKMEVFDYLGSTVLESISGIPQLSALLLDLGLKEVMDSKNGNASAGLALDYGYSGGKGVTSGLFSSNPVASHIQNTSTIYPPSSGDVVTPPINGPEQVSVANAGNITMAFSREFAIPLPSFLGLLSEKMIPLHNGFTIVLTLANKRSPFFVSQIQEAAIVTFPAHIITATAAPTSLVINTTNNRFKIRYDRTGNMDGDHNITIVPATYSFAALVSDINTVIGNVADPDFQSRGFKAVNYQGVIRIESKNTIFYLEAKDSTGTANGALANLNLPINQISTEVNAGGAGFQQQSTFQQSESTLDSNLTWSIDDVYMNCQILELGPVAESMILSSTQGAPLVIHTKSMRNYVGNVKGSTWPGTITAITTSPTSTGMSEFTLNMNLNVASLTNILWIMRSTQQIDSLLHSSHGNRTRNFLQRWQFQYGSTALPQSNGIQCMGSSLSTQLNTSYFVTPNQERYLILSENGKEAYNELMKARPHYLTSSRIMNSNFSWDSKFNYNLDPRDPVLDPISVINMRGVFNSQNSFYNIGRFAAGLNLQLANGKDGQIISGLNTNGMNTSIRGVFHPMYTDFMDDVRIDAWAEYDAFVNISPGIASTVSF